MPTTLEAEVVTALVEAAAQQKDVEYAAASTWARIEEYRPMSSDAGPQARVTIAGRRYLVLKEMAVRCGVAADQLRIWDRAGGLWAERLADVDPSHSGEAAGHRREDAEALGAGRAREAAVVRQQADIQYTGDQTAESRGRAARRRQRHRAVAAT